MHRGQGGQGGARGFRGTFGTITKVEGNTITVTDNQGQTVTVTISDNTPVVKTVLGSKSDLTTGAHITVAGTRSGNNVAATGIQITDQPAGVQGIFGRPPGTPRPQVTPTPGQ